MPLLFIIFIHKSSVYSLFSRSNSMARYLNSQEHRVSCR